jgi:hypothetical protein
MAKNIIKFRPSVHDETWDVDVSPSKLPEYAGDGPLLEIDVAYETILKQPAPEEFYRAAATLVFHARHLKPHQHAQLAAWLAVPYKRLAGRQTNYPLRESVSNWLDVGVFHSNIKQREFVARTATEFKTSKKQVLKLIQELKGQEHAT